MAEIQQADSSARNKTLWILLAGTAVGVVFLAVYPDLERDLLDWIENNLDYLYQNSYLVFLFSLLFVAPILVVSAYLFIYGRRVTQTRRLPPEGYDVVRDTRVHSGRAAIIRGRVIQVLAMVILLGALVIPFLLWYMFYLVAVSA